MEQVLKKRVAFHETDCMGIVHHSNYAKYFEEARVEYIYAKKLDKYHAPKLDYTLAVVSLEVQYRRPLKVNDVFEVHLEAKLKGATQVEFTYGVYFEGELMTEGKTSHVGLNSQLKVVKPPKELIEGFKTYGS